MAKNNDKNTDQFEQIGETISKTEQFIEQNKKRLSIITSVVIGLVVVVFLYNNKWLPAKSSEAHSDMYMAQIYFEQDSFNLALNGDGQFLGFLDLADEYSSVKEGKLANYYAGVCYMNLGEYENAIDYLENFSSNDLLLSTLALGLIGDSYMQLNDQENALSYYEDATSSNQNNFTTPLYLFKQAMIHEENENYKQALNIYQTIKEEYKDSRQANNISKYISRVENR